MFILSNKLNLKDVRHWTFAGSKDAFCIVLIMASFLLANPYFSHLGGVLQWALIIACLLWGILILSEQKVQHYFDKEFLLKPFMPEDKDHPFQLESSTPPYTRKEIESKPLQGLMAGVTTDTAEPVYMTYERLPQHASIMGSTGMGKSVGGGFLMMQQMRNGGGLLFIDGKLSDKELDGIYKNACWAGREVDLLIINPAEPEHSNTYNPILYGDAQEVSSRIMALMPDTSANAGADFYRSSALHALETIISAFRKIGKPYHFGDLAIVLSSEQALYHIEDALIQIDPEGNETIQFINMLNRYRNKDSFNIDDFKKNMGGLSGRLHQFATGTFGKVMNTYNPEVNLQECIMQNKIVYIMLPTMGKNEQAIALAKLIVADCRTAISRCQKLPANLRPNPPFMIFPDEIGSYIDMSWKVMLEQSRSSNLFFLPAMQTFANLEPNGDKALSEVVMGNTYFKFFYKQLSTESSKKAADELGKHIREATSISKGSGSSTSGAEVDTSPVKGSGDNSAVNITQRGEEVHIVRPEDFKAIPIGDCLMIAGGIHLYHLRIPFIVPSKEAQEEFSRVTLNRFQRDEVEGLDLYDVIKRYTLNLQ